MPREVRPAEAVHFPRAARTLRSTFTGLDEDYTTDRSPIVGHWKTFDSDLVLAARTPNDDKRRTLFGVVPRGAREGVLSLARLKEGVWQGIYVTSATLHESQASLTHMSADDTLELRVANAPPQRFHRVGAVNVALLQSVSIIGHRGLSLGRAALQNSLAGIRRSWLFGCSGVEIDVTVPYSASREPIPAGLKVYHPPEWRAEITGTDSVSAETLQRANAPDLQDALRSAADVRVPFVYIDPKLRWLVRRHPSAARESLERIVTTAATHLSTQPWQTVAIGTETSGRGEAADMVVGMRQQSDWPEQLLWSLEVTRGTSVEGAHERLGESAAARRPDVVSFNLLRVSGGGGGFLRLFVSTIPAGLERSFSRASQPVVYWTAQDDGQFEGALRALQNVAAGGGDAGIITPYPHRLAFYLATRDRPQ